MTKDKLRKLVKNSLVKVNFLKTDLGRIEALYTEMEKSINEVPKNGQTEKKK